MIGQRMGQQVAVRLAERMKDELRKRGNKDQFNDNLQTLSQPEGRCMNPTQFRFEIDADGIANATWDMPGRLMNVITPEAMAELADRRDGRVRSGHQGLRDRLRQGGSSLAAPTSPCLPGPRHRIPKLIREKGEEEAMPSSRKRAS